MKAVVVYESMYGNTHLIADAVAAGLAELGEVEVVPVGGATPEVLDRAELVVVGVTVLLVSMLTRYPLGIVKVLPFPVHSGGDYVAAALLLAGPFALNFSSGDSGLAAFYVAAGAAVLLVSLVTNYQYSPKRAWNAVAQPA